MLEEKEEKEEEETLNRDILSILRQAVLLVFIQMLISLYALWKPPLSEALIEKLDELLAGFNFPVDRFEGIRTFSYNEQGDLEEIIEQDVNLPKRKKITLGWELNETLGEWQLKKQKEEWIELEKGE